MSLLPFLFQSVQEQRQNEEERLCPASSADPTDYMQSGGIPAFNVFRGIPSKTVSFGHAGNSGSHLREFGCLTTGLTDNRMLRTSGDIRVGGFFHAYGAFRRTAVIMARQYQGSIR
jgi:hypothetical protein